MWRRRALAVLLLVAACSTGGAATDEGCPTAARESRDAPEPEEAPAPPPPPTQKVAPNGAFEVPAPGSSTLPLAWNHVSLTPATRATFSYPTENAHLGDRSVRVDVDHGSASWAFPPQPAAPRTTYRLTSWYQSNQPVEVLAGITTSENSTVYHLVGRASAAPAGWTAFEEVFTTPPDTIAMTVFHSVGDEGWVQLDDVSLVPFAPSPYERPLVSLTFDDAFRSHCTTVLPKLQELGYEATFYVPSGFVDAPGTLRMTHEQLQVIADEGMQIADHSVNHKDLTTLSPSQQDAEIQDGKTALEEWIGEPVTDFATPFGGYDDAIRDKIMSAHRSHRTTDPGSNYRGFTDLSRLRVMEVFSTTTGDDVASWLEQARRQGSWIILVFHDVAESSGQFAITDDRFEEIMEAVWASGLTVRTVADAREEVTSQLAA